jgi:hypothetical protein
MTRKYSMEAKVRRFKLFSKIFSDCFQSLDERELLRDIIRPWVKASAQSKPERICGHETLGIEP